VEELTYGSYLRIDELLALQQPRSQPPHPEELHFIIVHQALELWMKLALHDLERVIGELDAGAHARALALLGRVNANLSSGLDQMRSLHTLPPWALQQFRGYLGTASGFQSRQFRELELLSGLREESYLKALEIEYHGELRGLAWPARPAWPASTPTRTGRWTSTWSARRWSTTTRAGRAGARSTSRWSSGRSASTRAAPAAWP
jgi:tryptophan 2,3-dioxygenase